MIRNNETPRNGNVILPRDLYVVRCVSAKFGASKAGNPMTTLECETVSFKDGSEIMTDPEGKPIRVADQKFKMFLMYGKDKNGREQAGTMFDFTSRAIGITLDEVDPENPPVDIYVGKKWYQLLYSTPSTRMDSQGKPILDASGNPLVGPAQIQARLEDATAPAV